MVQSVLIMKGHYSSLIVGLFFKSSDVLRKRENDKAFKPVISNLKAQFARNETLSGMVTDLLLEKD